MPPLQSRLDTITANTRALVQPERLAITDTAVQDLMDSGIESRILPPGAPAPAFSLQPAQSTSFQLPTGSKKLVHSSDLLSLGPLILNFFRGRWCPYCVTELEAWQAAFPAVRERGALVVAISPQLPRQNDFLVQQHRLTFPVLSDTGSRVASAYGIAYTVPEPMRAHYRSILVNIPFIHGDQGDDTWRLPLPATIVIQPTRSPTGEVSGTILYSEAHADHRVRPDPNDILAVL